MQHGASDKIELYQRIRSEPSNGARALSDTEDAQYGKLLRDELISRWQKESRSEVLFDDDPDPITTELITVDTACAGELQITLFDALGGEVYVEAELLARGNSNGCFPVVGEVTVRRDSWLFRLSQRGDYEMASADGPTPFNEGLAYTFADIALSRVIAPSLVVTEAGRSWTWQD